MAEPWRNRIVGHGTEAPDQLLANPANWRIHSKYQQTALAAVLTEVGFVQDVIVNRTTGHVIDGHLRIELALSRQEPGVPVTYVELTLDEELKVLATFDPLGTLAAQDREKLNAILVCVQTEDETLKKFLADLNKPTTLPTETVSFEANPDAPVCPTCGQKIRQKAEA